MDKRAEATHVSIPAISFDKVQGEPLLGLSRRVQLASRGSFQAAAPVSIARLEINLPNALLAELEDATVAMSGFDARSKGFAAPLAALLLRTESSASSQVERLYSGAKQLGMAQLGISKSLAANLVVDNVEAMRSAATLATAPSASAIIAMHRALLERSNSQIVGKFRSVDVWVDGPTPQLAKFVGPVPQRIPALIEDLVQFMKRVDIPRVAQAALAHAQFETIHPFEDGNGRTGRALMHAIYRSAGIARNATIPVSTGLVKNQKQYFAALNEYRAGDAAPIIEIFIQASFQAVAVAERLISELEELEQRIMAQVQSRSDSAAVRIISELPAYPVINSSKAAELLKISLPAAIAGLEKLTELGILVQSSAAKRNRVWLAPDYLDIWESFTGADPE